MSTGPFEKTETTLWPNGKRKTSKYQKWYRSGKNTRRVPLYYRMEYDETPSFGVDSPNTRAGGSGVAVPYQWGRDRDDVHNRCYAKFVAKTQAAASQIGASLGERRQTIGMMEKRAWQLIQAARYLKRGYPLLFFQELGVVPQRWMPKRSDPKKAADLWLEWHFGWEPLYEDIYNACVILQSPVPQLIKVRCRSQTIPVQIDYSFQMQEWGADETLDGIIREQMGARISVSNPNLWRATQLGLTNPASILWELVPYSFVVDWFIPVGAFLGSWTDLWGLTVGDPYTTLTRFYKGRYQMYTKSGGNRIYSPEEVGIGFVMERSTSISGPVVNIRPWKGLSVTRAATAIALCIQQLRSLHR